MEFSGNHEEPCMRRYSKMDKVIQTPSLGCSSFGIMGIWFIFNSLLVPFLKNNIAINDI